MHLPVKIVIANITCISIATQTGTVRTSFADEDVEAQCLVSAGPAFTSSLEHSSCREACVSPGLLAVGSQSTIPVSLMCLLLLDCEFHRPTYRSLNACMRERMILSPREQSGTSVHSSSLPIPDAGDSPSRGQPQATAWWSQGPCLCPSLRRGKRGLRRGWDLPQAGSRTGGRVVDHPPKVEWGLRPCL